MGATALFVLALAQWSVSVRASCLALSLSVCLQMLDIGGGTPVRCALVPERSPFPKVWFSESARTLCVHWNSRDEERRSSRPCSVRSNPLCIGVTNLLRRWISGWTSSDWLAFGFKDLTVSDLYPPRPPPPNSSVWGCLHLLSLISSSGWEAAVYPFDESASSHLFSGCWLLSMLLSGLLR